jgi:signal transduction histidine kinase
MSFEEQQDFAKQVADLNKYGQALNNCGSVDEVVSLTLEAMTLLFDAPYSTVVESRQGDLRVAESTDPSQSAGADPSEVACRAYESSETVVVKDEEAAIDSATDMGCALAVPASVGDETIAVLIVRAADPEAFGDAHARALEILASHAATAISNIRSRERLERAREDLETRKEMVEMYDRLLRHDIGNDLQVIAGFADALQTVVDEGGQEYADKIQRAAESSADLIQRVGDLVKQLEQQEEPEPRDLQDVMTEVLADVDEKFDDLTLEYKVTDFDYSVYAGDLLDSVFTNLVSNAAVHNDGAVTMQVEVAKARNDVLHLRFADDGKGVPEDIRDEIFEMGQKGPDSEGSGFGLGFVRALTQSYGGDVSVTDSEMGGAEFRLRLKRA